MRGAARWRPARQPGPRRQRLGDRAPRVRIFFYAFEERREPGLEGIEAGDDGRVVGGSLGFDERVSILHGGIEAWEAAGSTRVIDRATSAWKELLDAYEAPPLDDAVRAELTDFVERRKVEIGRDEIS